MALYLYIAMYNFDLSKSDDSDDEKVNDERKKNTVRGLSGLNNQGNTCYMNSILQCLASLDIFRSWIFDEKYYTRLQSNVTDKLAIEKRKKEHLGENDNIVIQQKDVDNTCEESVINRLYELFKTMWKQNAKVTPKSFKQTIGDICSTFRGYQQQDSQELLNLILDRVHEETKAEVKVMFRNVPDNVTNYLTYKQECFAILNNPLTPVEEKEKCLEEFKSFEKNNMDSVIISNAYVYWKKYIKNAHSIITDLFTGMFLSKITCKNCNKVSGSFEAFTILQLPVTEDKDDLKLEDLINSFVKEEELNGSNQYFCEECQKKVDAVKKVYIWEPPNILVVQLKRYNNNSLKTNHKNNSTVVFPIQNLDLNGYLSDLHNVNQTKYDLCAISEQRGMLNYGHYVAYCKNGINNKWYEFDDDDVVHIPNSDLEKELITKNAYILFYTRKHN